MKWPNTVFLFWINLKSILWLLKHYYLNQQKISLVITTQLIKWIEEYYAYILEKESHDKITIADELLKIIVTTLSQNIIV